MSSLKDLGISAGSLARALAQGSASHEWEYLLRVQRWLDGAEQVPDEVFALALLIKRTEVSGPPDVVSVMMRQEVAIDSITPVLDEVARSALEHGWQPGEIADVCLRWAVSVALDLLGQDAVNGVVEATKIDRGLGAAEPLN